MVAKSKEQKRVEALERKRDHYVRYHLLHFIILSPIGELWRSDCTVDDMAMFIKQLDNLRQRAIEANLTLSGNRCAYDSFDLWSLREMFHHLIIAGTIHTFCGECNDNREAMQLPRAIVDPIDVWGPRLNQCLTLAEHPRIKEMLNAF